MNIRSLSENPLSLLLFLFLTVGILTGTGCTDNKESKGMPLDSIYLSDPCILADARTNMYYMTGTSGKLWKSKDLEYWEGPMDVVEWDTASWMGSHPEIWAAELHEYQGKYYYFATFTNNAIRIDSVKGAVIPRRASHVLVSDSPEGPYRPMGDSIYLPADKATLDGTFWVDTDGKPYMVYCHEWLQNWDGTIEKIELKPDLSGTVGEGKILFRASDSPWSREMMGKEVKPNRVTDGPWLFRTGTGRLGMIWTSWIFGDYTQGVAYSESGTLDGPWVQEEKPITPRNFGHGMLFKNLEGKWLMSVHSHKEVNGRYIRIPRLFEVDLSGDKLKMGRLLNGDGQWLDEEGNYINAHGGGILHHNGLYYWFGEHRPEQGFSTQVGVNCYVSSDLKHWDYKGVALAVSEEAGSDIERGCIMERPKVIYNEKTRKFVMWFHLELKGQGYGPARAAVAVSDTPAGPYHFVRSGRVNPGIWPMNLTDEEKKMSWKDDKYQEWWTPAWREAVQHGMLTQRDLQSGQMSRDMTLFVDDDGKAYHIYSSEENLTLQIAELSEDYMSHSGRYIRLFPGGHNEAPTIFKKDDTYWMITSGCTGWAPNEARMFSAPTIWGPWVRHPNPCRGVNDKKTFGSQGTFVLELPDNRFLFMADRWKPQSLMYSGYLWLPIEFDESGLPMLRENKEDDWHLTWSVEFDQEGQLPDSLWNFEKGYARNEEDQWYQPDNAYCKDGLLVIEARKEENRKNPLYEAGSQDWRKKRENIRYTSSSVTTADKKEFLYGRFDIRAKIPTAGGAWPAIWFLGSKMEWPSCGEIDVMEYYRIKGVPHILANACWGTDRKWHAKWNSKAIPFSYFTDKNPDWKKQFHIWRMDWDKEYIRLYLDNELLNEIPLSTTFNGSIGEGSNPFHQSQYLLLNLALGGINGGNIDEEAFPMKYEIDYVRYYQK